MKLFAPIVIVAAVALSGTAQAATNLISNGSFENGIAPGGFVTVSNGDGTSITDWLVGGDSVDYIGTYWNAFDGVRSLDMSGNGPGTIAQSFATSIGTTYNVTFDVAGNPDGPPTINTLAVSATGGPTLNYTFDKTGESRPALGWTSETYSFVATGTSTLLTFASVDAPGTPYGPALDNVFASAAVPEPTIWTMLLIGFFGVGAMMRRTNRLAYENDLSAQLTSILAPSA